MKALPNKLKGIIGYQILYGSFSTDQSLLNGRMGLTLFFIYCSRLLHNRFYEDFAGELLEDICMHLPFDADYVEDLKNACQRTGVDWQSDDYIPEKVWKRVVDWWQQAAAIAEVYNWKRGIPLLETY